jgi:hypothetical protein
LFNQIFKAIEEIQMQHHVKKKLLVLIFGSLFVMASQAAPMTLSGSNFDIIYDDSLAGLFNSPTLVGDTVFFTPVDFKAESLNGAGFNTANSTINLKIIPKNGLTVESLNLVERGDYKLRGANSFVNVGGQTRVFDLASPLMEEFSAIATVSDLTIKDGVTHGWQSDSLINLSGAAWQARDLNYTIENLLEAYTESTDVGPKLAFIEKKFAGSSISLVVTTVPEADTYAMLLAGFGVLSLVARRKSRS